MPAPRNRTLGKLSFERRAASRLPSVSAAKLKPAEGMRVIDGLVVKEYVDGAWRYLCVATLKDLAEYPTVGD